MLQALFINPVLWLSRHSLLSALAMSCLLFSTLAPKAALASSPAYGEQVAGAHIQVGLVSEQGYLVAGETAQLALRLLPEAGWHTYWKNPGDTGLPTRLAWQLPEQFKAGNIEWPIPGRIDYEGAVNFGYHGETWLPVSISVPASIEPSAVNDHGEILLSATAKWLVCKDVCIPGKAELELRLPLSDTAKARATHPLFDQARSKIPRLVYGTDASYAVGEGVGISVALSTLPALQRSPQVFIGNTSIVDNFDSPKVTIDGETLHITAKKDTYLEDAPELLSVLLVTAGTDDGAKAFEFVARQGPALNNVSVAPALNVAPVLSETTAINVLYAILLALAGGLILNAMPCVFPVLSLKIVSLVESGNLSSAERQRHGCGRSDGSGRRRRQRRGYCGSWRCPSERRRSCNGGERRHRGGGWRPHRARRRPDGAVWQHGDAGGRDC